MGPSGLHWDDFMLDLTKLKLKTTKKMRIDDVGDYYDNEIISYRFDDKRFVNAILLHELVEYILIDSLGLYDEQIDMFDKSKPYREQFSKKYKQYKKMHKLATIIEKQYIKNLGIKWNEYNKFIRRFKVK